jgi:hypothetical protein
MGKIRKHKLIGPKGLWTIMDMALANNSARYAGFATSNVRD